MRERGVLYTENDLSDLAKDFVIYLRGGEIVCLSGPLGAGKTSFVRYVATHLRCAEEVSSPTYILQHIYKTERPLIEHWDLYRVTVIPDELLSPPEEQAVRLIEWGDKFTQLLNSAQWHVAFDYEGSHRKFSIRESQ